MVVSKNCQEFYGKKILKKPILASGYNPYVVSIPYQEENVIYLFIY